MYKNKSILSVIPARGGSKGLPKKNVLSLAGKPLIAWTIEQAHKSCYLDRTIVSTDSKEIAEIASAYNAEVPFLRPPELAKDITPMIDVLSHVINFFSESAFDYVALLEPTSPLRASGDIDNAIKKLVDNENGADSLVSVGQVHLEHPSIIKKIVDGYVEPYAGDALAVTRRQELGKAFFPYGVIYLSKTDKLIEKKTFYQTRTIPFLLERWQNYEVDDLFDFICVETVLENKLKELN